MAAPELKTLGRYTLQRVLGKGAMGIVYEGLDPKLNRRVAIKTILRSNLDEATARSFAARFVQEAHAVARLNHPHIVQVHDFGEEGDVSYLVMEFIRGKELKSFFDANERFEIREAARIMSELCDALEYAHQAGIVHRDVKPGNVMLDSQARTKLTDFGVARVQDVTRSHATQEGTMVGTPAYMSPEQIAGARVDRRTDVFSAGIILYQFLTGELPFSGGGPWTIAKKIMQDEPPLPSSLNNVVTPPFDAVVNRALAKNPDERFQSAQELGAALKLALDGKDWHEDAEKTIPGAPAPARPAAARGKPAKASPTSEVREEADVEFWRSIKDGNEADDFDAYLEQFPNGIYAALAKRRSAKLRGVALEESSAKAREQEKRELEEAARREIEAKSKIAEERARLETEIARKEQEIKAREAEHRRKQELAAKEERSRLDAEEKARKKAEALAQKQAEERTRHEAELKKREAALKAQAAASGRKSSPAPPITIAVLVLALAAGGYYFFARDDAQAQRRIAEMEKQLEAAKQRAAELENAKKREEEARVALDKARKAEEEAKRSDDLARQKQLAEERVRAEAEARKTAEARAAQEKALAAEKARAEKLAQERATAEKAASEKRAAEERERLAREKAATEKAAAAKAAAAAPPKIAAPAAAAASRLPQAGETWTYRHTDLKRTGRSAPRTHTVSVTRATDSAIVERFAVEGGPSGESQHAKGVYLVSAGAALFSPYLHLFDDIAPGTRLGRVTINEPACSGDYQCNASAEVAGRESVKVPAGTFDCIKIVVEQLWSGTHASARAHGLNGGRQLTMWYSPQVKRAVKFSSRLTGGSYPPIEADFELELVSYGSGGGSAAAKPAAEKPNRLPAQGDRWSYRVTEPKAPGGPKQRSFETSVISATGSRIVELLLIDGKPQPRPLEHASNAYVFSQGGLSIFAPYLLSFQDLTPGAKLGSIQNLDEQMCAQHHCETTVQSVGRETIQVEAGKFDAIKVVIVDQWQSRQLFGTAGSTMSGGLGGRTLTIWYSPQTKRALKFSSVGTAGTYPPIETDFQIELVSYKLN